MKRFFYGSINSGANNLITKLEKAFEHSAFFSWLRNYPQMDGEQKKGLFATLFGKISKWLKRVRRAITGFIEESHLFDSVGAMMRVFLEADFASWGVGAIIAGFITAFGKLMLNGGINAFSVARAEIIYGTVLMVVGAVFLTQKDSVGRTVCNGVITRFIFIRVLRLSEPVLSQCAPQRQYGAFAILGLLLGCCNLYFPTWMPGVVFLALLAMAVVFSQPEVGFMALIISLPFVSTGVAVLIACVAIVAFAVKNIRGKRMIKYGFIDVGVILFFVAVLVFGLFTSNNMRESLSAVLFAAVFILTYFCIANSMSTKEWTDSIAVLLFSGALVTSSLAIYQYFKAYSQLTEWIKISAFETISEKTVATFGSSAVLAQYLVAILPIALAVVLVKDGKLKLFAGVTLFVGLFALALTYSISAWIALLIALAVFALIYNPKNLKVVPFLAVILPVAYFYAPSAIAEKIAMFNSAFVSASELRQKIYQGVLLLARKSPIIGIGMGEGVFTAEYGALNLGGAAVTNAHSLYLQMIVMIGISGLIVFLILLITTARLTLDSFYTMKKENMGVISLGIGTGIGAMMILGFTENVWYNNRIMFLFWILLAFLVACGRIYNREWNDIERGD